LLEEQAQTRVPELVPIRYGRMLVSPFTFYRGAAYLMASDLSGMSRTSLHVQLCGDAHLSNFGVFAAPDRRLVFSINDFDETHPGPFEWDVKRLAASVAVQLRSRSVTRQSQWPAGPSISSAATATPARPMSCRSSTPLLGVARVISHLPVAIGHASVLNLNGTILVAGGRDNDGALPGGRRPHGRAEA
jgi:hypothetical protein